MGYSDTLDEVWAKLDRAVLFPGAKLTADYATGIECPFCKKKEAWIRRDGFKLRCNRQQKCGREIHVLSHIAGLAGGMPRGEAFKTAVLKLAALAGVPPPSFSPEAYRRAEETERRRSLLGALDDLCRGWLHDAKVGRDAREYLTRTRGFPEDSLTKLPLGLYTHSGEVRVRLVAEGYDEEELEAAGILRTSWHGRLVGPWRDWRGWVESFWARDMTGESEKKILYKPGTEIGKLTPYGLDVALLHEGREDLVLVEGPLDALHLHARGRKNVAALGGSHLSGERLALLARAGVRKATLLLDNDPDPEGDRWPGLDGSRTAVRNWVNTPNAPVLSVTHPRNLGTGIKDPDELLRAHGVEAYDRVVAQRVHGLRFLAEDLVERRRPPSGAWSDDDLQGVLGEAQEIEGSLAGPARVLDLEAFFWNPLREVLQLDRELVEAHLAGLRTRLRESERQEKVRHHLDAIRVDLDQALDSGHVEDAKELLWHGADRLRITDRALRTDPILTAAEEMAEHEAYLERWRGREYIGLAQQTLPSLDQATLGLRGLMLLAAAPNVGKTALAVQLGMDILETNPDACFLFVSLEMRRQEILTRIRCKLAQMDWKTLVFGSKRGGGEAETSYTPEELSRIRLSREHLEILGSRLSILDEQNFPQPTAERVLAQLEDLKRRTGCPRGFLLVDYLQVWPIPDTVRLRSELDEDKWRIGQMKTLRDQTGDDAVMVVSELRKPQGSSDPEWKGASLAHIMGSARGAYTPDIVFLFNRFTEKEAKDAAKRAPGCPVNPDELAEDQSVLDALSEEGISPVRLEIAKGRDGVLRRSFDLTFWYRQARFEEGLAWEA